MAKFKTGGTKVKRKLDRAHDKNKTKTKTPAAVKRQVAKNTAALTQGGKPSGPFKLYVKNDPFRPWYSAVLRYTQSFSFISGAAGVYGTEQIMRLNSLFDPDFTGVGHQPYGYDQMSLLYRRYKVNAVTIIIDIYDPNNDGSIVAMQLQAPGGTFVIAGQNVDAVKEQPMSITRNISDSGSQRMTIKQYFPMHSLIGVSPIQFKSDLSDKYTGLMGNIGTGSDPTEVPYLRIAHANRLVAGANVQIRVTLMYHSQFYNRIVQAQS